MLYRLKKILNNNVAIALDERGEEVIVTGKGLGFANKAGDLVHERLIRRVYTARDESSSRRLKALFSEIPYECVDVAEQIVDFASAATDQKLGQGVIVSLADHISFAVEQTRSGTYQKNLLSDEIENFYPAECVVGRHALALIEDRLDVRLDSSEAASIAFHIINNGGNASVDIAEIIQGVEDMVETIQCELGIEIPRDSSRYARLITHLKFLMRRVISGTSSHERVGPLLLNTDDESVKGITRCLDKVADFLGERFGYDISDAERLYLFVHIVAIAQTE